MPFVTSFVEDGRGFIFRGEGFLTEDELAAVRVALQAAPEAMRRLSFALVDLENVLELRLDHAGVSRLIAMDEHLAKLAAGMAVAIVATSDHAFGIARMWKSMAGQTGWPIAVVRSRSEAHVWLDDILTRRVQAGGAPLDN